MKFDYVLPQPIKFKQEGLSLFVSTCSSRDIKPQSASSIANLMANIVITGQELNLIRMDQVGGVAESLLSSARQRKLDMAFEGPYTHMLCLDDDMIFPYDTLHRLLGHNKPFVCANACQKIPGKVSGVCLDMEGKRISSTSKTGLEEIGWGSLAVALLELDSVRHISKPHFEVLWEPTLNGGRGGYQGEDHYFMKKLKQSGIQLYCDHDLSQLVKHVGDFPYGFG